MHRVHFLLVLFLTLLPSETLAEVARWIRFDDAGTARYGKIDVDQVHVIEGLPWGAHQKTGRTLPLGDVRPLIPTEPHVVLGAAYNYRSHLGDRVAPSIPQLFWKTTQSLIADGEPIRLPGDAKNAHYEAELVIVIGRTVENATLEQASDAIFGFTCGNDISERAWQQADIQWWRGKATRTFGPVGPEIVTGLDWRTLRVQGYHNGKLAQDESAGDMIFSPAEIIQQVSRYVTLQPGDLIFTASPGKTEPLRPGDTYEVVIDGVGRLRSPIEAATRAE